MNGYFDLQIYWPRRCSQQGPNKDDANTEDPEEAERQHRAAIPARMARSDQNGRHGLASSDNGFNDVMYLKTRSFKSAIL
jgi:hypothetical protein